MQCVRCSAGSWVVKPRSYCDEHARQVIEEGDGGVGVRAAPSFLEETMAGAEVVLNGSVEGRSVWREESVTRP